MFYTRCYNLYGKLQQMLDWNTKQKFLKMDDKYFLFKYLYIKQKLWMITVKYER
jgi:hypothetical protein